MEQYNDFGDYELSLPVYLHKGWTQVLVKPGAVPPSGLQKRTEKPHAVFSTMAD